MDTDAILRRHPQVAVVDEFPHTNVPGSPRLKRWEDVLILLDAGIDVLTTMNVQHLEPERPDLAEHRCPRADHSRLGAEGRGQVVMVDLTPGALLNRLARGVDVPRLNARRRPWRTSSGSTLVALRELAMRQAAYSVESRLPDELPQASGETVAGPSESRDRLLLVLSPAPSSAALIRRGRRVADNLRAECLALRIEDNGPAGIVAAGTRSPRAASQLCQGAPDRDPRPAGSGRCGVHRHLRAASWRHPDLRVTRDTLALPIVVCVGVRAADRAPRAGYAGDDRRRSIHQEERHAAGGWQRLTSSFLGDHLSTTL